MDARVTHVSTTITPGDWDGSSWSYVIALSDGTRLRGLATFEKQAKADCSNIRGFLNFKEGRPGGNWQQDWLSYLHWVHTGVKSA